VLRDIGAGDIPQVLVYNKLDNLDDSKQPRELIDVLELEPGVRVPRVFVSALEGRGLPELRRILASAAAGTLSTQLNSTDAAPIFGTRADVAETGADAASTDSHPQEPQ
jgi:GTP-binding protein HflX